MATATQPRDPRRDYLRRQAILRREQVLERISGTRILLVGGVVAATCVLAGYLDANAHTRSSSTTGGTGGSFGSSGSGYGNYGGSSHHGEALSGQNLLGGSPPSSSSGSGGVVSGGS